MCPNAPTLISPSTTKASWRAVFKEESTKSIFSLQRSQTNSEDIFVDVFLMGAGIQVKSLARRANTSSQ